MVFFWDEPKYWSRLLLNHMAKWCWWVCFWLSRLFRVWVFWPRKHLSLVILCCKFVGYFLFEMDQVGKLPLSRPVTRYVFSFYWRLHVCTKKKKSILMMLGFKILPCPFKAPTKWIQPLLDPNKMDSTVKQKHAIDDWVYSGFLPWLPYVLHQCTRLLHSECLFSL